MSDDKLQTVDRGALARLLGPELQEFAGLIPEAMAGELLRGDRGYIGPDQLSVALLSRLRSDMRDWATPDVLRALSPGGPLARNRMQAVAGAIAPIACQAFSGFCHYPYIPFGHVAEGRASAPLIVAVHGSSRNAKDLRDAYAGFAERYGCFVLAPLFPIDLTVSVPDEEYKHLVGDRVRYDAVLWAMIDEFAAAVATRFDRVLLFGFSGGAQFAHRLLYVAPRRLAAVSVGAPTYVTLPDDDVRWPTGLAGFADVFGGPVDTAAMRDVPVQLLCGSRDDLACDIYQPAELGLDAVAYANYGRNRPDRLDRLEQAWTAAGISVERAAVADAGHAFAPLLEASKPFFARILATPPVN